MLRYKNTDIICSVFHEYFRDVIYEGRDDRNTVIPSLLNLQTRRSRISSQPGQLSNLASKNKLK